METSENPTIAPTPASAWKGKVQVEGTDLPLPSGNVARIKQMSPQAFLSSGVLPDPLSAIVRQAVHTKRGLPPEKIREMADDPEKIQASLELFDRVLVHVAVMPVVKMPPKCTECGEYFNVDDRHRDEGLEGFHTYTEGKRHPDVLYSDTVDLKDKIFIFQFCMGGTRDLETFRLQLPTGLGGLADE
jgi:hypothetical protein